MHITFHIVVYSYQLLRHLEKCLACSHSLLGKLAVPNYLAEARLKDHAHDTSVEMVGVLDEYRAHVLNKMSSASPNFRAPCNVQEALRLFKGTEEHITKPSVYSKLMHRTD